MRGEAGWGGRRSGRAVRRWPLTAGLLLLLLPALSAGGTPIQAGEPAAPPPGLTITQHMRCPEPPSDSVMTLEPTGAATILVTWGMDRRTMRTLINYKRLTGAEMAELAALLRAEGFDRIPEPPPPTGPPSLSTHPCRIALEIRLDGRSARVRYDSDPETPSPAKTLAGKIQVVLDRHAWRETAP